MKVSGSRTAFLALAGCATFLSVAACGGTGYGSSANGSGGSSGYGNLGTVGGGSSVRAGPSGINSPRSTLNVTTSTALGGPIVTDSQGYTLYRFDRDSANPPKSRCEGECAKKWLPATADGQITVTGLEESAVGTVRRPDGSEQITLSGWPLYRYAQDQPGELRGVNVGGAWFATSPAGKKVEPPPGSRVGGNPMDGDYGGYGG